MDPGAYPVNVSKAIDDAGLSLMWRPLPRLFGVYVESGGNRGVLVNSVMTRATRRHTAAHELGHHEFGHRPDPARQCAIEPAGGSSSGVARPGSRAGRGRDDRGGVRRVVPDAAKGGDRRAGRPGLRKPTSASEVYQLSLLLGTTFRATCRHLANLRIVSQADADAWARVQPARLKRDAGCSPPGCTWTRPSTSTCGT